MAKTIAAIIAIAVFLVFYFIYGYYFTTPAEAPVISLPAGGVIEQSVQPTNQPPETAPQYPTGFHGPAGMPFIQGPTGPPPGHALDLVENRRYYQFTTIDCASRWRYLKIYENYSNSDSVDFLKELIKIAPFRILAIKTDSNSNFTNRDIPAI